MFDAYQTPPFLGISGGAMQELFSADTTYRIWRRLWLALAEAQAELGVPIKDTQLAEMREHVDQLNHGFAALKEREMKQQTAAHQAAFAAQCPKARSIIALGVDDNFVRENGEIVRLRAALLRIKSLLVNAIAALADVAEDYRRLPCLSYLRLRPNAVTTLGLRVSLWLQDLLADFSLLEECLRSLRFLGCRGANGNSQEMLALFSGNGEQVVALEQRLAEKMEFPACYAVSGPTAPRKLLANGLAVLSAISQTVAGIANDLRLMQHSGQLHENAERRQPQPGQSSKSERLLALAQYVIESSHLGAHSAAMRSAEHSYENLLCRQLTLPQAFFASDAMLCLLIDLSETMCVDKQTVRLRIAEAMPEQHDPLALIGMAATHTESFLYQVVDPLLQDNQTLLGLEIPALE